MDGGPDGQRRNGPCIERGTIGQTARMARAIWSGTLTFGLVTIPVKLYPAVQRKTVRFNQLDGEDNSRIQQRRVNSATGEEVPYDRLVKGYEISPDRYVVITQEELESLDPKRSRTIEIEDFVDEAEIDPIFYDATYYVAPGAGGAKPYRLLLDSMRESGRVGIARVVLRTKEYLVALRPTEGALQLSTLLFADEVVDPSGVEELEAVAEADASERELGIAEQLIGSLAASFEPEKYTDEYRARVLDLIDRKAQGEQIEIVAAPAEAESPVPDLMSALKASLDAVREREPERAARKPAAKKRAAKKPAAKKPAAKRATASRKPSR
jgi:DNA end-binding protein Ku